MVLLILVSHMNTGYPFKTRIVFDEYLSAKVWKLLFTKRSYVIRKNQILSTIHHNDSLCTLALIKHLNCLSLCFVKNSISNKDCQQSPNPKVNSRTVCLNLEYMYRVEQISILKSIVLVLHKTQMLRI